MRIDSCRKCGIELEINKKCYVCNKPNQFFCHSCSNVTEEQIHLQCMIIESNYKLLEYPIVRMTSTTT